MNKKQLNIDIMDVGHFLNEEFLKPMKLSQREVADKAGLDICCINSIIHNKRKITADVDLKLSKLFGLSDGYFTRIQMAYEIRNRKTELLKNKKYLGIKPIQHSSDLSHTHCANYNLSHK